VAEVANERRLGPAGEVQEREIKGKNFMPVLRGFVEEGEAEAKDQDKTLAIQG